MGTCVTENAARKNEIGYIIDEMDFCTNTKFQFYILRF